MKREVLHEGKLFTVVKLDDHWEVVEHGGAVAVLVLRGQGERLEVLGVRQPRPALGTPTWEVPAGLVDEGERPDEAAIRELEEEAGLRGTLREIVRTYSSPGFTDERITVFEAVDVASAGGTNHDEGEEIEIDWQPLERIWSEIQTGRVTTSSPTVIALLYALGRAGRLS